MNTNQNVCKGAWELGTACGKCTRCLSVPLFERIQRARRNSTSGDKPGLPTGWVACRIECEPGEPEDVAYGPKIMMDRLQKWLTKHFQMLHARRTAASTPAGDAAMPVVAYRRPELIDFTKATRTSAPESVQKRLQGVVMWGMSMLGDSPPVTDKDGVEHAPEPLVRQADAMAALAAKDAEIDRILAASRYSADLCAQALDDVRNLTAERDELRKDAERYRFAMNWRNDGFAVCARDDGGWSPCKTSGPIDRAMAKAEKP